MSSDPHWPSHGIAVPDPGVHGHTVQFYDRDESFIAASVRFCAPSLSEGGSVIGVLAPEHVASFRAHLEGAGVNLALAEAQGRLMLFDAREALASSMVDGVTDEARLRQLVGPFLDRAAAAGPDRPVRAFGEMAPLLCRDGNAKGAIRVEEIWERLRAERGLVILCGYAMQDFGRASHETDFRAICDVHNHVVPAESFTTAVDPAVSQREVAVLQQRARALEREVALREVAERSLQQVADDLAALLGRERVARADAESASRAKDEFLALLGHELRNPLAPIVTALELRSLRGEEHDATEWGIVDRQTRHLVRLVDDLQDVSRLARGKVTLEKEHVLVAAVFAKALETARPLLEQRRHEVMVDVPEGLTVHADAARLAQVVGKLLSNAAKYTEPGGSITLTAWLHGKFVVLRVRDTGIGIAPEIRPRIFDLFVQERRALDRSHGGLGLGLAIVHNLVLLHGGTVDVASDGRGAGSTFTVRLPADGAVAVLREPAPSGRDGRDRAASSRILVVDDDRDAATMLSMSLCALGHTVRVVSDGASALRDVDGFEPDIALLDIGLPGMDGYELALLLRQRPALQRLRIVAVTGYGQEVDRRNSAAAEFDAHLVKPVSLRAVELLLPRRA